MEQAYLPGNRERSFYIIEQVQRCPACASLEGKYPLGLEVWFRENRLISLSYDKSNAQRFGSRDINWTRLISGRRAEDGVLRIIVTNQKGHKHKDIGWFN